MNKDQRKCLCFVVPSLASGGMERVMSTLANYFSEFPNYNVHLILLTKKPHFYSISPNVVVHEPKLPVGFLSVFRTISLLSYVRTTVRSLRPHCLLSFGEMFNSFVLLACIGLRVRIFVSDRSRPDKQWGAFHETLRIKLYPLAYGIIAQTAYAKEIMLKRFHHPRVEVIGNPIKEAVHEACHMKSNVILSVGRLIKSKRHQLLIEHFASLNTDNWSLIIIGDGPELVNLKIVIQANNMNERVKIVASTSEIDAFYRKAKIFAFTSNSEGFPNVLGEAMSHGLIPVVYNFVAGASDLVTHGENGYIVEMDDHIKYRESLAYAIENYDSLDFMRENARESISKFSEIEVCNHFHKFLLNEN